MASQMLVERRGSTLVLTLSDPGTRNTLSPQACIAGTEAIALAEADEQVRCLILRGDGEHFCSGGNLQRLAAARQAGPQAQAESIDVFHAFIEAIRGSPKPVIAAVEGHAAGGGASLVLACDLVVAAEDATFTISYGRAGLSPDGGATWHLARALPRAQALQAIWLAEPMGARHWQQLGLVMAVTDTGQTLDHAVALAERLARMAPNALASVKHLVNSAGGCTLAEQLGHERDHFVRNLMHANAGEGIQAFFEKRPPTFR